MKVASRKKKVVERIEMFLSYIDKRKKNENDSCSSLLKLKNDLSYFCNLIGATIASNKIK